MLSRSFKSLLAPLRVALDIAPAESGPTPARLHRSLEPARSRGLIAEPGAPADLAVATLPMADPDGQMAAFAARGCGAVVVVGRAASGGAEGEAERRAVRAAAAAAGLRCVGPSRLGLMLPHLGLFAGAAPRQPEPGHLALITASDSLAAVMIDWALSRDIGFSAVISLGETDDQTIGDVLDHLTMEPHTRAAVLHVEQVRDPRRFMSAARSLARAKPVTALKTGSARRARLAASTPGARGLLVDGVYDAAFRRAGVVRAGSIEELFDAAELLEAGRLSRLRGAMHRPIHIVSNGAAPARLAADLLCDKTAGAVAALSDLGPEAGGDAYEAAIRGAREAAGPRGATVFTIHAPTGSDDPEAAAASLARALAGLAARQPVLTIWLSDRERAAAAPILHEVGAPCFATVTDAVNAFAILAAHERAQAALTEIPEAAVERPSESLAALKATIAADLAAGRAALGPEGAALLLQELVDAAHSLDDRFAPQAARFSERADLVAQRSDAFGMVLAFRNPAARRRAATLAPANLALAHQTAVEAFVGEMADETGDGAGLGAEDPSLWRVAALMAALSDLLADEPRLAEVDIAGLEDGPDGWRAARCAASLEPLAASPAAARLRFAIPPFPRHLATTKTIKDGRTVTLRPIRPEDARALQRSFDAMTPQDRRTRLFSSVEHLTDAMAARFTQIDYDREMCFVIESPEEEGEIWGGARIVGDPEGREAEFSVSLRSALKGLGLGRLALSHVLDYAKTRGYREVWGSILRENSAMLGLAERLGFVAHPDPDDGDVIKAVLDMSGWPPAR